MSAHWSAAYIGIPYVAGGDSAAGCDCYGLVRLIHREQWKNHIPDYRGRDDQMTAMQVATLLQGAAASGAWHPVTSQMQPGDVAVFRRGMLDQHLGLVISHGLMLHVTMDKPSHITNLKIGVWRSRLTGIWRHAGMRANGGCL